MDERNKTKVLDTIAAAAEPFVSISAAEKILTGQVLTDTQQFAIYLDRVLEVCVFPIPYKSKKPVIEATGAAMPWKRFGLTHHRMRPDAIAPAFAGRCNIAVGVGSASGNFFAIDCDSIHALDQTIEQLRQRGIPVLSTKSGRGGHVWLRSPYGEVSNIIGIIPDVDILGHDRYVIAPPSMHPNGQQYRLYVQECQTPPVVEIEALDWFTDANGKPVVLKYRKSKRRLKLETVKYLDRGESIGKRNISFYRAASALYRAGLGIQPAVNRARADGLPDSEIKQTAKSATKNTPRKSSENASYQKALRFAAVYDGWQGRAGSTDKAVFLALCERLKLDSRGRGEFHDAVQFRAAVRELSELSHIGTKAVQAALYRLQGKTLTHSGKRVKHAHNPPLIQRMDTNDLGANKWVFTEAVLSSDAAKRADMTTVIPYGNTCICTVGITAYSADVLEQGALGLTGVLVYETLAQSTEPLTISDIMQQANITESQARYALRVKGALRKFNLVVCEGKKWTANTLLDKELAFAEIAIKTGKGGAGEIRQARHKLERENRTSDLVIRWRKRHDPNYPGNTAKRRKQAVKAANAETPTLSEKNA